MTISDKYIIQIYSDIKENTVFYNKNIYVINGEIHILKNVSLTIEDNTTIYIKNGTFPLSYFRKSVLIFDSGSALFGETIYFLACDKKNNKSTVTDNGGIWFCGTLDAMKEGIKTTYGTQPSYFIAKKIYSYYLGSIDPKKQKKLEYSPSTDNDSITLLGCNNDEFCIEFIYIEESGDNGIDIVQSYVTINNLVVNSPGEDALNMDSSTLTIVNTLILNVPLTKVFDRDILDLEVDTANCIIKINQYCYVELYGIFGDQTTLVSDDLPQPTDFLYVYKGITKNGQSYIYRNLL
jgi:hypothetical protein